MKQVELLLTESFAQGLTIAKDTSTLLTLVCRLDYILLARVIRFSISGANQVSVTSLERNALFEEQGG